MTFYLAFSYSIALVLFSSSLFFAVRGVAGGLVATAGSPPGFLPEMDEGAIVLDYESPSGTSLQETDRMLRVAEKLIVRVP